MRYRTQHDMLPWAVSASDNCNQSDISAVAVSSTQFNAPTDGCLEILFTSGEMASSFVGNLGTVSAERLLITAKSDKNAVVCFAPESKSFKENARSMFAINGDAWTSGDRYYCFSD